MIFNRFIGTVICRTELRHIEQQVLVRRIKGGFFQNMNKIVIVRVIILIE